MSERKHDYTSSRCWCGEENLAKPAPSASAPDGELDTELRKRLVHAIHQIKENSDRLEALLGECHLALSTRPAPAAGEWPSEEQVRRAAEALYWPTPATKESVLHVARLALLAAAPVEGQAREWSSDGLLINLRHIVTILDSGMYPSPQTINEAKAAVAQALAGPVEGQAPQGHFKEYQRGFDAGGAIAMDAMRQAPQGMRVFEELVAACEADFCSPETEGGEAPNSDDEAVGGGDQGECKVTFGMIRRARAALSAPVRDAGK